MRVLVVDDQASFRSVLRDVVGARAGFMTERDLGGAVLRQAWESREPHR